MAERDGVKFPLHQYLSASSEKEEALIIERYSILRSQQVDASVQSSARKRSIDEHPIEVYYKKSDKKKLNENGDLDVLKKESYQNRATTSQSQHESQAEDVERIS